MKDITVDELDELITVACKDRDAYAADLRAAEAEVERLRAELEEAQATIANERGEGEPPEPGWKWNPHARFWHRPGATVHWSDMGRSWWWSDSPDTYRHYDERGPHKTARAAMRAAIAAIHSLPETS